LRYQALASGSNGNCAVVDTPKGAILIDAGISRKRIIKGITKLGIPVKMVKYILITHAHWDHIQGLPVLSDHLKARVVATPESIQEIRKMKRLDPRYECVADNAVPIMLNKTIELDNFTVTSHPTIHDIAGATGFTMDLPEEIRLSYVTDTADVTPSFVTDMKNSDVLVIESNHNISMLEKSRRPYFLKKRIKETHLSNTKTIEILQKAISDQTKAIILAHLSGECNHPKLVCDKISKYKSECDVNGDWNWVVCTRQDRSSILQLTPDTYSLEGGVTNYTFRKHYRNHDLQGYFDH
jgi:phosphoribosyl 1,2-cyclic phosphodiesterase